MTVKEAIEALQKCHADAPIYFSVDWDAQEGLVGIEHEVMWLREKGDDTSPGLVYLHNNNTHICNEDGTLATDNFLLT
jgi:hypothetical protein